ncbi:hypothetical protein DFQ14_101494 [Halopolyspora algeriensis]|uniref:Uncharacterized protein n=1 Tax=Halopolyspora algeriensis TaxID=1500506 RepID=A0A368W527_9ACTN|nr:hypothetical protein DFQ14_101494 [Halopolyspora algeriensis]TQM48236.1 hypothetical protein FHU43_3200 [Halopolyspora algeriensis]
MVHRVGGRISEKTYLHRYAANMEKTAREP